MRPPAAAIAHILLPPFACACGDNAQPPLDSAFHRRVIDPEFRAEGVTVFDVDRDGVLDIVTEELWYAGPRFEPHAIRDPRAFDPQNGYAHSFSAFHDDIDGDGYDDLISYGPPGGDALWCRNPQGRDEPWQCYQITPNVFGESPYYTHLFGDTGSLLTGLEPARMFGYMTASDAPETAWTMNALTGDGFLMPPMHGHGLGIGDIDGDGRLDVLTGAGWMQRPADPAQTPWPWHPVSLCPNNCAHMFAFDVNDDGRSDLVGTSPHNYGAWWFEQLPDGSFQQHEIDSTNSQNHAAELVDLDDDGLPELVTGKRWRAHLDGDPGAFEPVLLLIYKLTRDGGDVRWTRIVIDEGIGIGTQFAVVDIDGNGRRDIIISSRKGVVLFERL
jgi:hypothetical protein